MKVCGINKEGFNEVMDPTANGKTLANLMASGWFFPGMVKLKSFT